MAEPFLVGEGMTGGYGGAAGPMGGREGQGPRGAKSRRGPGQSAQITQAQLPGDFIGCLEIGVERSGFDV